MHWLLASLIVIGALLVGSVPTVGTPEEMVLVPVTGYVGNLDPMFCDGRHIAVVSGGATLVLPNPGTAGMECSVISMEGAATVSIVAAAGDIFSIENQDGTTVAAIQAINLEGASVTLLRLGDGLADGDWTPKRHYGNWTDPP